MVWGLLAPHAPPDAGAAAPAGLSVCAPAGRVAAVSAPPIVHPWLCRACRKRLGVVLDGVLRLHDQLVVIDKHGNALVRCRWCGQTRGWHPVPVEAADMLR